MPPLQLLILPATPPAGAPLASRPATRDVRWRLASGVIALAVYRGRADDSALTAASEALSIAPCALDVRANIGSLSLLKAHAGGGAGSPWLDRAQGVFEELTGTGWDPGFAHYRLGMSQCVRGDFDQTLEYLHRAADPAVRHLFKSLDRQLAPAAAHDATFTGRDL